MRVDFHRDSFGSGSSSDQQPQPPELASGDKLIIDAGIEQLRIRRYDAGGLFLEQQLLPTAGDLRKGLLASPLFASATTAEPHNLYITGKLAEVAHNALGYGEVILPTAALWSQAQGLMAQPENSQLGSLAIIDLSASGYLVLGVDANGELKDDLLSVNPRCGAGSGVNIDRVLQKLAMKRDSVDPLLAKYLGEAGREARDKVTVRADRCGVFSSSATISDKNQGIPLETALAVTLKSEVLKVVKKVPAGFARVYLTGGVFAWQFTRDCAADYLRSIGIEDIGYDHEQAFYLEGVRRLIGLIGTGNLQQGETRLRKQPLPGEYPAFRELREGFETAHLYRRLAQPPLPARNAAEMMARPVILGLDVGSTMAKLVVADAATGETLLIDSYSNAGDTIDTLKSIFRALQARGISALRIAQVGITGSARYQVQETIGQIYPQLKGRVQVLVENYAHARGSIEQARDHIEWLKAQGHTDLNEDFFILVDIGGEDTKLSTVSLKKGELFDNAMNVKCSAGTGSLMDSLSSLFGLPGVGEASTRAFAADKSYVINATCAVFLMENARKLQAQGYPQDQILASACWAIVENMARTLWDQVELPGRAVALLHGQTMLSDPLPLAVTHRMQEYAGAPVYALVPGSPGHRACFGLVKSLTAQGVEDAPVCELDDLIQRSFNKKIIQCKGAACGDKAAVCNRTSLTSTDEAGGRFHFTLGGCSAINEVFARKKSGTVFKGTTDSYKQVWDFINEQLPRSDDANRLVIPRSFAVSEWSPFLAALFGELGIPVHVDNVREKDILDAQPKFHIDTCAPHIGAVGQMARLAAEPHGMIVAPQIDFLPVGEQSLGRTCTINQGGLVVASNLATLKNPQARFHIFTVSLRALDSEQLSFQLLEPLQPVFAHYALAVDQPRLQRAIDAALDAHRQLRAAVAEMAADIIETALDEGREVALITGREYILNPGIYDSHVGRLLRDKQISALPAYVLDLDLDPRFAHIYWRNPHFIVTVLQAIVDKTLHEKIRHPRLRALFERIENHPDDKLLPVVQVSTFRCGPDSVTTPLIAQIMKSRPFLLIQSDAVIKELAHLENRVNTYIKQLEQGLHQELAAARGEKFEVAILDDFTRPEAIDAQRDVIYFPTLADNRVLTSVMRAGGYTCIDNYDDESYDLPELVKLGRKMTGDSVCAPLAAVYGDIGRAVADFTQRMRANDPLVAGKRRVLVFNNKGSGPCRQGQYVESHKLLAFQEFGGARITVEGEATPQRAAQDDALLQFLVSEEKNGFSAGGLPEWVVVRAIQGVILQGVLHTLLFEGGAACRDYDEYQRFLGDYRALKQELYAIQERDLAPGKLGLKLARRFGDTKLIGLPIKLLAYRFHNRTLHRALARFAKRWNITPQGGAKKLGIYIEGEAYMRAAQAEEIFRLLLATLGFDRFQLRYSPVWVYLSYLIEEERHNHKEQIRLAEQALRSHSAQRQAQARTTLAASRQAVSRIGGLRFVMNELLARPLYRAAGLAMPESMESMLTAAREILPTLRPAGELAPYVGEALNQLRHGVDIFLNVAPEGCMVASMGEVLTPKLLAASGRHGARMQNLFSADGDVDEELLTVALLKSLGPQGYYSHRPLTTA